MRKWRAAVTGENGVTQHARLEAISMQRLILNGTYALPIASNCYLQILIPKLAPHEVNRVGAVKGVVESVVFVADLIRLTFKISEVPVELRQMIDRYGMEAHYQRHAAQYRMV